MTTHALPDVFTAADEVFTVMKAIPAIDAFENGIDEDDVSFDTDGKVHGYAVLWPGGGTSPNARLSRQPDTRFWGFQVTAAGGDSKRTLWVAGKVQNALCGLRLTNSTPINQEPGPDRVDRDGSVSPARYFIPLLFSCRLEN